MSDAVLDRHRIAHGMVSGAPNPDRKPGEFPIVTRDTEMRYFLGAPWYSINKLQMEFQAMNSSMIRETGERFRQLATRAGELVSQYQRRS